MSTKKATGIDVRHQRGCATRSGGRCNCAPTYQAQVSDRRSGRRIRKTFDSLSGAKFWRQDAQVALRKGTLQPAGRTTVHEAADALVAGMRDGSVLNRSGRPYKPSSHRGYAQLLNAYVLPTLGDRKLSSVQRRDVQDLVDGLRRQELSPSTIANALDPLRVIFRRAIRRDEIAVDPTVGVDMPAVRGRRDRIESPAQAQSYLDVLPPAERAFWAVALFAGLRRGELRGLRWADVDFAEGLIRVARSWDPVAGAIEVKTTAGERAVPMAGSVRRELASHKLRSGRDGDALVFGRTPTEPFYASTIRARARKAWKAAGLEPLTPHEARHCAISYFIASGMDWKQISVYAGHGDVRQTWNRYGHLVPGGEQKAADQLSTYLDESTFAAKSAARPS
jgi:integrase